MRKTKTGLNWWGLGQSSSDVLLGYLSGRIFDLSPMMLGSTAGVSRVTACFTTNYFDPLLLEFAVCQFHLVLKLPNIL